MISQKTIDAVLDAGRIYDVVKDFVELRRSGSGWVGLCPFHSERTPSFHVDAPKHIQVLQLRRGRPFGALPDGEPQYVIPRCDTPYRRAV